MGRMELILKSLFASIGGKRLSSTWGFEEKFDGAVSGLFGDGGEFGRRGGVRRAWRSPSNG
jgi:hypothetical protein